MTELQLALTTTFVPGPACTADTFDQLLYSRSLIYLDYPQPRSGLIKSACYPSQFIESFLAQQSATDPLPPIVPLVCPEGYTSARIDYGSSDDIPDGYLVCCPSEYELAGPTPPWPADRPAFGATCRSPAQSAVITPYSADAALPAATWLGTAGDHVYALPLEGYVTDIAVAPQTDASLLSETTSSGSSDTRDQTTSAVSTDARATSSNDSGQGSSGGLPGGAIAGAVLGPVVALLIGFYALRKYVQRRQSRRRADDEIRAMQEFPPR